MHRNVNPDFSAIAQPFQANYNALESASQELSKTQHGMANDEGRKLTWL